MTIYARNLRCELSNESFLLSQISELFMEGMSLQDVYNLTCNATAWRELFWFPPSTNVTALTSLICTLNEKEAEQFMATLMMVYS